MGRVTTSIILSSSGRERTAYQKKWIKSPDNIVPIPKLKHWEINRWLDTKNEEYLDKNGIKLTPRQYIKGKPWDERREFGLMVLRKFGVLKR